MDQVILLIGQVQVWPNPFRHNELDTHEVIGEVKVHWNYNLLFLFLDHNGITWSFITLIA